MNVPPETNLESVSRIDVGELVLLLVTDPRLLTLVPSMQGLLRVVTIVTGDAVEAAGESLPQGRFMGLTGHVGEYLVHLRLSSGERLLEVAQVVFASATPPPIQLRTGVHWLRGETPDAASAMIADLASVAGPFERPHSVHYDRGVCAGGERELEACGRCVPACPYEAIARGSENSTRMTVDHLACEGCGACASVCPTDALTLVEPDLQTLLSKMRQDLEASEERAPWVLVHCGEEGRRFVERNGAQGAAVLALPCLRAVSDAMILTAFALGASGVALVGCEACQHGVRWVLQDTLERNRLILRALDADRSETEDTSVLRLFPVSAESEDRVQDQLNAFRSTLVARSRGSDLEPYAGSEARLAVTRALEVLERGPSEPPDAISLSQGGPYAHAEVDPDACTVCGSCASICAPGAFSRLESPEELRLTFRSRSCVACGLCESICPENAIRLRPTLRLGAGALDDVSVAHDTWAHCITCGTPFFSTRALEVIERRLAGAPGPSGAATENIGDWLRTCDSCRKNAMRGQF